MGGVCPFCRLGHPNDRIRVHDPQCKYRYKPDSEVDRIWARWFRDERIRSIDAAIREDETREKAKAYWSAYFGRDFGRVAEVRGPMPRRKPRGAQLDLNRVWIS